MTSDQFLLGFLCGIAFAAVALLAYAELADWLDQ